MGEAAAEADDAEPESLVWTGRGLLSLMVSTIPLIVAEIMLALLMVALFVLAGGIEGADAGSVFGGLIGIFVTLGATLLGLVTWAVVALLSAALMLVATLARQEAGPRHRILGTVGALLLIGSVVGTLATDGGGMLIGSTLIGGQTPPLMTSVTTLAVVAMGAVGLILLVHDLQGAGERTPLYAFGGIAVGAAVVSLLGGVADVALLLPVAVGLAATSQVVYLWITYRTRARLRAVVDIQRDTEPTPDAAETGTEEPASTPEAAMVVACTECGAHVPVETDERPTIVECGECGQRGVVKAPPPGAGEEE